MRTGSPHLSPRSPQNRFICKKFQALLAMQLLKTADMNARSPQNRLASKNLQALLVMKLLKIVDLDGAILLHLQEKHIRTKSMPFGEERYYIWKKMKNIAVEAYDFRASN